MKVLIVLFCLFTTLATAQFRKTVSIDRYFYFADTGMFGDAEEREKHKKFLEKLTVLFANNLQSLQTEYDFTFYHNYKTENKKPADLIYSAQLYDRASFEKAGFVVDPKKYTTWRSHILSPVNPEEMYGGKKGIWNRTTYILMIGTEYTDRPGSFKEWNGTYYDSLIEMSDVEILESLRNGIVSWWGGFIADNIISKKLSPENIVDPDFTISIDEVFAADGDVPLSYRRELTDLAANALVQRQRFQKELAQKESQFKTINVYLNYEEGKVAKETDAVIRGEVHHDPFNDEYEVKIWLHIREKGFDIWPAFKRKGQGVRFPVEKKYSFSLAASLVQGVTGGVVGIFLTPEITHEEGDIIMNEPKN